MIQSWKGKFAEDVFWGVRPRAFHQTASKPPIVDWRRFMRPRRWMTFARRREIAFIS